MKSGLVLILFSLEAGAFGYKGPASQLQVERTHRTVSPILLSHEFNGLDGPIYGIEDYTIYLAATAPLKYKSAIEGIAVVKKLAQQGPAMLALLKSQVALPPDFANLKFDMATLLANTPPFNGTRAFFLGAVRETSGRKIWEYLRRTYRLSSAGEGVAQTVDQYVLNSKLIPSWHDADGVVEVFKAYALAATEVGYAHAQTEGIPFPKQVALDFIASPFSEMLYHRFLFEIAVQSRNPVFAKNIARVMALEIPRVPGRSGVFIMGGVHVPGVGQILNDELGDLPNFSVQLTGRIVDPKDIPDFN